MLLLARALAALVLRLPDLDRKLMHGDEAVHTYKLNELRQTGRYDYDPHEYHGPTLYYFTLPGAWLSGAAHYQQTTATTYRIVPVVFGIGLVLLLLLAGDGLGRGAALVAGLLTALSPAMTFYSRHYIQEMPLVFFTFLLIVAGWRCVVNVGPVFNRSSWFWAILAGVALGFMHATKETTVIVVAALIGALLAAPLWVRWILSTAPRVERNRRWPILLAGALVAALTSVALYSVCFTNFANVAGSIWTYSQYADRAARGAHLHPWYYYLELLGYVRYPAGPIWTEALILLLGVVGLVVALGRRAPPFVRFLAFYTLLLTILYSAIPYKTPWCALGFLHGFILLAGGGAGALLRWAADGFVRLAVVLVLLTIGVTHLGVQAWRANFDRVYANDVRNPHIYAHPVGDVLKLTRYLEQLAAAAPAGRPPLVRVMVENCWPLPWYLRGFERVGYYSTGVPDDADADVIIVSTKWQGSLDARIHGEYDVTTYGLRRDEGVLLYVQGELRAAFERAVSAP